MAADRFHLMGFEDLERRFHGFIERHANTWAIPDHDADDIRQVIHITLFECQRGYRPELGVPFFPYFKRSVINKLCKINGRIRRRRAIESGTPLEYADAEYEPDFAGLADNCALAERLDRLSAGARAYIRYKLGFGPRPAAVTAARAELRRELSGELTSWLAGMRTAVREGGGSGRVTGWRRFDGGVR